MSKTGNDNLIKRRRVLLGFGRFGVLGLLGGLAAFGEAKRRKLLREGKCINGGICDGCGAFGNCGLPRAISFKQSRSSKGANE